MTDSEDLKDFSTAKYTAVVSDLHLCEEEPVHSKYPLWKKYKTRQFFFDEDFASFLKTLESKSGDGKVELLLNGDIFDFDSVTSLPKDPPFRMTWLERRRGLHPSEEKSAFKIKRILQHHTVWLNSIRDFLLNGNRVIFIIGNHDLELYFPKVQHIIFEELNLPEDIKGNVRFVEWFYLSNKDTLIEHGNQYDPYCLCEDPVNPYILRENRREVRVPFGNLATRYLINGMGFFNPHLDSNFIMTPKQYVVFFFKYMLRAQPLLIMTWFWGACVCLFQSFIDRLRPKVGDPFSIEDRIEYMATKANCTPRMIREMNELIVTPASSYPMVIAKELWLDRAFIVLIAFLFTYIIFLQVNLIFNVNLFIMFIPLFIFLPFFIFYSRSVKSEVAEFKEPREKVLSMTGMITKVNRVIYGHTHLPRHENIGAIEHLNSGTWSPAFEDIECKRLTDNKTYIWIYPNGNGDRTAQLLKYEKGRDLESIADTKYKRKRVKLGEKI